MFRPVINRATRRRKWPGTILGVALFLAAVWGVWAFLGSLIKEWRSGAGFSRYKNWQGLWVSHADGLIFGAAAVGVMVLGAVWSAWDRGSERRLANRIARGKRGKLGRRHD